MPAGAPEPVIDEIVRRGKRNLTVIANDTARPGASKLIGARLVTHLIASHSGLDPETQQQITIGELAVDLVPQGTAHPRRRGRGWGGLEQPAQYAGYVGGFFGGLGQ